MLRDATDGDRAMVLRWRNHPQVRRSSFTTHEIGADERGEMLAAWIGIERESISYAFDKVGATVLRGEVLASNAGVWRLHRRFGFTETGRYVREVDGLPREVVRIELRKDQPQ